MEEVRPASWTAVRVARPARDLTRSTRFYRDLIGLPLLGGFENHDGYNGVFFALPGGAELELTAGPAQPALSTDEDLLVLYVQIRGEAEAAGARLTAAQAYDARARGCRTASLQSTPMAERVYAAVGFRDLGRILEYIPRGA